MFVAYFALSLFLKSRSTLEFSKGLIRIHLFCVRPVSILQTCSISGQSTLVMFIL